MIVKTYTVIFKIVLIKESKEKYHMLKKMNNIFNIDNKSVYYYDFWRSCDTVDGSNDAENTALIAEINYILTDINIGNQY